MAQAAVVLREKRRKKFIHQDIEEALSIETAQHRRGSYSSLQGISQPQFLQQQVSNAPSSLESIHFGATNASIASSGGRKDSKVSRIDDERRKKLEQLNEDGAYNANNSANVILYVGLGMIAIGLIITFVGLGDKGFQTLELKLIGPSLVGCGIFFALLRILFCTVPSCFSSCGDKCSCCIPPQKKEPEKKNLIESRPTAPPGEESIIPPSRQESAKSRSTPLPPIVSTQPSSSLVRSHFHQPASLDSQNELENALELASSAHVRKDRGRGSGRQKSSESSAFRVRSLVEKQGRIEAAPPHSLPSAASSKDKKSLDEFSLTDSDLISPDIRKKIPDKSLDSPKASLKNCTHELVLSTDGL